MSSPGDGPYRLIVTMRIQAEGRAALLNWLVGGHLDEVAAQPGFSSAELITVDTSETSSTLIASYRIESREAFERYEANLTLKERFAAERAPFEHLLQVERVAGPVVAEARPGLRVGEPAGASSPISA